MDEYVIRDKAKELFTNYKKSSDWIDEYIALFPKGVKKWLITKQKTIQEVYLQMTAK